LNPSVRELLPPERPAGRPFPWCASLIFFLPAAALAAGTGLQRILEGALPPGDALFRWPLWCAGAGVALGGVCAVARRGAGWLPYGAISPLFAVALVALGVRAARPVREWLADRREADCRDSGRATCTAQEFRARCAAGDAGSLGPPRSKSCGDGTCTSRWLYDGPFRPDDHVAQGSLLCSVVTDRSGKLSRSFVFSASTRE
jgi:hypothetical protein